MLDAGGAQWSSTDLGGARRDSENLEEDGLSLRELCGTRRYSAKLGGARQCSTELDGARRSSAELDGSRSSTAELGGGLQTSTVLGKVRLSLAELGKAQWISAMLSKSRRSRVELGGGSFATAALIGAIPIMICIFPFRIEILKIWWSSRKFCHLGLKSWNRIFWSKIPVLPQKSDIE